MYCTQCGQPLMAEARFCGHCGALANPAGLSNPVDVDIPVTPAVQSLSSTMPASPTSAARQNTSWWLGGAALVALALGGGAYWYAGSQRSAVGSEVPRTGPMAPSVAVVAGPASQPAPEVLPVGSPATPQVQPARVTSPMPDRTDPRNATRAMAEAALDRHIAAEEAQIAARRSRVAP